MASPRDRQFILELVIRSAHPALLEGLDNWLQLGLITDELVRQLCAEQLVCPVSQVSVVAVQPESSPAVDAGELQPMEAIGDFLPVGAVPQSESRPTRPDSSRDRANPVRTNPVTPAAPLPVRPPTMAARLLQSFMAELSVLWLLFLGVFLVVVSSGVLAATQWRNFSAVGQYSILLGYTLVFWGVGWWTGKQAALQLTSRMLNLATLLIIPVNFWMMDGFRLGQSPAGLGMAAIASFLLTGILILLLKPDRSRLMLITAIALSWLHWGWGLQGVPLGAVYGGTVGAAAALVVNDRGSRRQGARGREEERAISPGNTQLAIAPFSLSTIAVAAFALILIGRAALMAQVPISQLGLALGICGWVLCWLARQKATRADWVRAGAGLLLLGWLVAVMEMPWQAIAVSGLALWLLGDRLHRLGSPIALVTGFLVGLQVCWLGWRVVPVAVQTSILEFFTRFAGTEGTPFAFLGLGLFPYVLLTVGLAFRLKQWQRPELARYAEFLALGLGSALTVISLNNAWVRSLNLLLSAITLIIITTKRVQPSPPLIYLTHGITLAAIASGIDWAFPTLSATVWAGIVLIGMVAEWSISVGWIGDWSHHSDRSNQSDPAPESTLQYAEFLTPRSSWQVSAWYFGLVLAASSYVLLSFNLVQEQALNWGGMWLTVPLMLTLLGNQRRFSYGYTASWFSSITLLLVQPLMFTTIAGRLIGLGLATGLMLLNTRQVRHLVAAVLTVGFGLGFLLIAAWEIFTNNRTFDFATVVWAIAVLLLWLLQSRLLQPPANRLKHLYQQAADGWATGLTLLTLVVLTLSQVIVYFQFDKPTANNTIASTILMIAIGLRLWQGVSNLGFYAIAWSVELLLISSIALTGRSLDTLGIANLALGLATQLGGDWMISRRMANGELQTPNSELRTLNSVPSSFHVIPILYALLGVIIQHRAFTATTGWYTFAAALVGLGVGRRQVELRSLTLLSLGGVSIAAYQLLLYQLLQATGGSSGDGITLLAGLALGLAIAYYALQRWLISYLQVPQWLWQAIAHAHWGLGSILLITVLFFSLNASGEWLWTAAIATAAAYALTMGRNRGQEIGNRGQEIGNREQGSEETQNLELRTQNSELRTQNSELGTFLWIYAGIAQGLIALTYWLHRWLPDAVLIDWAGAIAAVISVFLYFAPWQRWGWNWQSWRQAAIVLPAIAILLTGWGSTIQTLLIVAAFYGWLSSAERRVSFSYISVLLADWAILRMLSERGALEPLWIAAVIGASLLYWVQVEPSLRSPNNRETRHWLRCLATGIISLTAFYQAQIGIAGVLPLLVGLGAIAIDLAFIFAGVLLKIRALLYVGTASFILQVLWQVWRFISDYSLVLWAIGIAVGLLLIWIAATFEARRSQVNSLLQRWIVELDDWE
ncbi:hypothetical protein AB3R30_09395 [Leptolyngbyaceae cyanobacterium UHCC 1019]